MSAIDFAVQLIAFDIGNDFVVEADLVVFIVVEASEEGIGKSRLKIDFR